jgi:hypothetical protein
MPVKIVGIAKYTSLTSILQQRVDNIENAVSDTTLCDCSAIDIRDQNHTAQQGELPGIVSFPAWDKNLLFAGGDKASLQLPQSGVSRM